MFSFKQSFSRCHAGDRYFLETSNIVRLILDSYAHMVGQRYFVLQKKSQAEVKLLRSGAEALGLYVFLR